jgi:hypothetical protein
MIFSSMDFTISGKGWNSRMAREIRASGLGRRDWYRLVYLKSKHWTDLRGRKLESCGRVCDNCGHQGGNLHVHHLRYRKVYNVRLADLQVLCSECHKTEHQNVPEIHRPSINTGLNALPERELAVAIASGRYHGKLLRRLLDEGKRRAEEAACSPPNPRA